MPGVVLQVLQECCVFGVLGQDLMSILWWIEAFLDGTEASQAKVVGVTSSKGDRCYLGLKYNYLWIVGGH